MTQPPDDAALVARIKASVTYGYMPMAVRRCLSEAATALEAKDRRIAEADGILTCAVDAIFELAMDAGNLVVATDNMADLRKQREDVLASLKRAKDAHGVIVEAVARAALDPSDKGVGR